jgi:tetratricopeptide (TPR) repeat protein
MRNFILAAAFVLLSAAAVWAAFSQEDLEAAVMQKDYQTAVDMAQGILKSHQRGTDVARVQYYLGISYLGQGEYMRARDVFKKALSSRPQGDMYDRISVGHIDSMLMQGYYEKALKEITTTISRRPSSEMMPLFYLKAARANLKLARWAQARDYLRKITEKFPDAFEAVSARQLLEEKNYFTVQVGSFTDRSRAEKLVRELVGRREYAYMVEIRSADGHNYYRVRVGRLSALKDAQALEEKLSGLGYPTLIYP